MTMGCDNDRLQHLRHASASRKTGLFRGAALVVLMVASAALAGPRRPAPPGPPAYGPGSNDYLHAHALEIRDARDAEGFYLFEPTGPRPRSAPVVVFLHGYSVDNPRNYAGWITHLVRKGNIVIYPIYQSGFSAQQEDFAENAVAGVQNAFAKLQGPNHVRHDGSPLVVIGHSLGAVLGAYFAAEVEQRGLPPVGALMLANAAESELFDVDFISRIDFSAIHPELRLLAVVGDQDQLSSSGAATAIIDGLNHVPAENKVLLELFSDKHGIPELAADHSAPGSWHARPRSFDIRESTSRIDALDFYGYWKWADALVDLIARGENAEYAFGNTFEQTFMGFWSDGKPVAPAEVLWP